MRNLRRLWKLWNDVLDGLEAAALAWHLRAALARHKPVMIDDPSGVVNHLGQELIFHHPWCMVCVKHWPCPRWEEVARLADKLDIDKP